MKKLSIKKLFSLIMGIGALSLVAVISFFTGSSKILTAQAEEAELPDTSMWEEVEVKVGDKIANTWFRFYTNDLTSSEWMFVFENIDVKYQYDGMEEYDSIGKKYRLNFFPPSTFIIESKIFTFSRIIVKETYIDFYISDGKDFEVKSAINSDQMREEKTFGVINSETCIAEYNERLKILKDASASEPTPDDGNTTPDDGTEESTPNMTDKLSNWLNETFGLKTNGNVVGMVAIILAGFFILKVLLGRK